MRHQELEYIPVGLERAQHLPNKRGFLLRWLCSALGWLRKICPCEHSSRGGEVEEPVIKF